MLGLSKHNLSTFSYICGKSKHWKRGRRRCRRRIYPIDKDERVTGSCLFCRNTLFTLDEWLQIVIRNCICSGTCVLLSQVRLHVRKHLEEMEMTRVAQHLFNYNS